jgi:hypothetical protein
MRCSGALGLQHVGMLLERSGALRWGWDGVAATYYYRRAETHTTT